MPLANALGGRHTDTHTDEQTKATRNQVHTGLQSVNIIKSRVGRYTGIVVLAGFIVIMVQYKKYTVGCGIPV